LVYKKNLLTGLLTAKRLQFLGERTDEAP